MSMVLLRKDLLISPIWLLLKRYLTLPQMSFDPIKNILLDTYALEFHYIKIAGIALVCREDISSA